MAKSSVLIVDDDVNARIIAETLLQTRGWRVHSAGDGIEACEVLKREATDVVVMELALPGMNGWELIRHLRGRFRPMPIMVQPRIVVVSRQGDEATESFALRLGADAFLKKPLAPGPFVRLVESLLATPRTERAPSASLTA